MLESHLTKECKYEKISCCNDGCDVKIERGKLIDHLKECNFKCIKCQFCGVIYIFKDEEVIY